MAKCLAGWCARLCMGVLLAASTLVVATPTPASAAMGCWVKVNWSHVDSSVRATPVVKCNNYPYYQVQLDYNLFQDTSWKRVGEKHWFKISRPARAPWIQTRNELGSHNYCLKYELTVFSGTHIPYSSSGRNCLRA